MGIDSGETMLLVDAKTNQICIEPSNIVIQSFSCVLVWKANVPRNSRSIENRHLAWEATIILMHYIIYVVFGSNNLYGKNDVRLCENEIQFPFSISFRSSSSKRPN